MGVWVSAGVSGGHINPAVCISPGLISVSIHSIAGHHCSCDFPRLSMEKSLPLYFCSDHGRILWCWHRLLQLLPGHKSIRGWTWYSNGARNGQYILHIRGKPRYSHCICKNTDLSWRSFRICPMFPAFSKNLWLPRCF